MRHAVIGLHAADDLLRPWFSARIVGIPEQLDLRVVRFRTGIGEEHFPDRKRRHVFELLRQRDGRLMAAAGEEMAEGELAHLLRRRLDQRLLAPAERRAPEPGHCLDVILAALVIDAHALAPLEHERACFAQLHEVGVGVQNALDVARLGIVKEACGRAFEFARRD